MKRICTTVAAGLTALSMTAAAADETGVSVNLSPEVYVGASAGVSFLDGDAGGFNTLNGAPHTGTADLKAFLAALTLGVGNVVSLGPVSFRGEIELSIADASNASNPSTAGGGAVYAGSIKTENLMFSLWADYRPLPDQPLTLSLGAGGGVTRVSIQQNDVLDFSSDQDVVGSYMFGAQAAWDFDENWTAAVTGRYVGVGSVAVPITSFAGAAGGTYTQDISGFQALATVRLRFPVD